MSVSDRLWRVRKFAILGAWNLKYLYFKNIRFVHCRSISFFHLFTYNSYLIVIPKYSCYILLFIYKIYYYTIYIFLSAVRDFKKCHLVILKRCRLRYCKKKYLKVPPSKNLESWVKFFILRSFLPSQHNLVSIRSEQTM